MPSPHFNADPKAGAPLCGFAGGLRGKLFSAGEKEAAFSESSESSERGEGTGLSISSGGSDRLPMNVFVISSSGSMECLLLIESQSGAMENRELGSSDPMPRLQNGKGVRQQVAGGVDDHDQEQISCP